MDLKGLAAKVLEAVMARLIVDGIEAAAKKALHFRHKPKHLK